MHFQSQHAQALLRISRNYLAYVKYTAGIGAVTGTALSVVAMSDIQRPMLNTEKALYPLIGCLGGAFLGTTAPVWIVFAPVVYVLGPETAGKLVSGLLAAALLNGDGDGGDGHAKKSSNLA